MPDWVTISLREDLIKEVRTVLKTGRYRSISEFVSEAIRLRLEEISRSSGRIASTTDVEPSLGTRDYINVALERSEQIWWVLVRLFGDLIKRNIGVDLEFARELRNCRTLINFVRSHACPECDLTLANERLPDLHNSLAKLKHDLVAVALSLRENYARDWIDQIDKAERSELRKIPSVGPKFVPGLGRDRYEGWTRITLTKPVSRTKVQEVSKQFGITTEFETNLRIILRGDKKQVAKAVHMIYQLQSK